MPIDSFPAERTVIIVSADDPSAVSGAEPDAGEQNGDGIEDSALADSEPSEDSRHADDSELDPSAVGAESPPAIGANAMPIDDVNPVADNDSSNDISSDERGSGVAETADESEPDAAEIVDEGNAETTEAADEGGTDATETAEEGATDALGSGDESSTDPADITDDSVIETAGTTDDDNAPDAMDPIEDESQPLILFDGFTTGASEFDVDCANALPCTFSSVDGAVSLVVENVYRHPQTLRLAIALSVTASRDTALRWDDGITGTDNTARTFYGTDREFSNIYQDDRDNDTVPLFAGTEVLTVQHFRERPLDDASSILRFKTGYTEAGIRTVLRFSNLPLDPVLGDIVDCNHRVPCAWVSNDRSYSVNVVKASGLWHTGRLRVDFEVAASIGLSLHVYSSDPVVGNDGTVFRPGTHGLNGTTDYREFTESLVEVGVLRGFQDFKINPERLATSLVQVKLGMSRVHAPAAGSPVFRNLPLE